MCISKFQYCTDESKDPPLSRRRFIQRFLRNKRVIFFDLGDTLGFPASGDWMFTNRFLALAGRRLGECTGAEIRRARQLGMQMLETLSQTHQLGIISDTWPSIENQLSALGIRHYFSCCTYSCDLGVFKPDGRIYLDALKKCGCAPDETVFVDDRPENLEGAAKLGITPILIAANPEADVPVPYRKIHSLSELIH